MNRWPTIVLLLTVLVGLVLAERSASGGDQFSTPATGQSPSAATIVASAVAPATDRDGTAGSTWYCPAGFTTPDAANDHVVVIVNQGDEPALGSLTVYPSLVDTLGNPVSFDRAVQPLEIEPHSTHTVSLAPIVAGLNPLLGTDTGSFAGALVELDAPGVRVEHRMVTPVGAATSYCVTSASTAWWFPSGTTTSGVTYQLYLLNPFPDDAVVDISFVTDGGVREPASLDGRLIPSRGLTMIDITPIMPVWPQVATEITTRTGRVIAERIQIFTAPDGPVGLTMAPGVPQLSDQWFFPAAGSLSGAAESYVIQNPNSEPAEVEFELKSDRADRAGDIAPLPFVLGPNERWVVNVSLHAAHPSETVATIDATTLAQAGERYFVSVRSFNGVPIAVERLLTRGVEAGRGVSQSPGVAVASTDQLVAVPAEVTEALVEASEGRLGELAVLNPAGDTISRVEIWVGGSGGPAVVRRQVELAPRRRASFDLDTLLQADDRWIRIVSTTGTMVELVTALPASVSATAAVPAAGTLNVPDLFAFD